MHVRLAVQNFRKYHGFHEFLFPWSSPSGGDDPSSPLILLKGSSGDGKSTLLMAFTWVLYGELTGKKLKPIGTTASTNTAVGFQDFGVGPSGTAAMITHTHNEWCIRRKAVATSVVEVILRGDVLRGDAADAWIRSMFGSKSMWYCSSYVAQGIRSLLLTAPNADKYNIIYETAFGEECPDDDGNNAAVVVPTTASPAYYIQAVTAAGSSARQVLRSSEARLALARDTRDVAASAAATAAAAVPAATPPPPRPQLLSSPPQWGETRDSIAKWIQTTSERADEIKQQIARLTSDQQNEKALSIAEQRLADATADATAYADANAAATRGDAAASSSDAESIQQIVTSFVTAKQTLDRLHSRVTAWYGEIQTLEKAIFIAPPTTTAAAVTQLREFIQVATELSKHFNKVDSIESIDAACSARDFLVTTSSITPLQLLMSLIGSGETTMTVTTLQAKIKFAFQCILLLHLVKLEEEEDAAKKRLQEVGEQKQRAIRQLLSSVVMVIGDDITTITTAQLQQIECDIQHEISIQKQMAGLVVECPTCHNNICVSTAKRATPGIRLIAGGSGDQSLKFAKAAVLASTFESQAQDEVARATATLEAAEAEFGVHTTDLSLPQEKLQSHQSLYEYVSSVVWKRSPLLQSINVKQAAAVIVATAATAVKQVPIPFQVVTLQYLLQTAAATTNFKRYHELLQQLGLRSPPTISSSTFMNQISQYISKKEAFNVENASYQQAAEEYAKIKAVAVAMMKSSENDVDDDLTIVKTLNQRIQQIVAQRERKRMTDEALRRAKDEVATALRRRAITTPAAAAAVVGSVDELRKEEYFLRTQIPLALADQAIAVRRESQEAEIARLQSVVTAATERMNTAAAEVAAATERCRVADEAVAFIVNVANRTIEQTIIDMTSITNAVLSDLFPGTSVSINIRKKGAARTRTGGFVAEIVISTAGGGVQHDGIGLLSGGETDRISLAFTIALAVLSRSPFLLLDECMASLDSANRRLCFAAIRKYLTNKKMVINVCHDEDEGGGYYDHVVTVT